MDENFDLQNEMRDLYFNEGGEQAVKKFEEEHNLNSISLPCNQKKKIVDQAWEDFENMVTPGYNAMVCDNSQGLVYPLRKFNFLKNTNHVVLIKLVKTKCLLEFFLYYFF